ncbi:MAG: hypothetical protein R2856_24640 [Caldilineaceae bacterium]
MVNRIWEMSRTGMEEYRRNAATTYCNARTLSASEQEFETIREKFLCAKARLCQATSRPRRHHQHGQRTTSTADPRGESSGLSLLNSKNWGQVMDEVDISSSKWSVMDTEQHIRALSSPIVRPPSLNLRLHTRSRSGNL